ncbi:MAG: VWA domain-containing protein [Gammaproteobacteria bacterium]|nr:VWA domain-containing protein [Gammaproteobacteria bacterium]
MSKLDVISLNYLDSIPDAIYQRVITHQYRPSFDYSHLCSLQQRVTGILDIKQQLLNADPVSMLSLQSWLDSNLAEILYTKLTDKKLLKNTFNNVSYTNDVLLYVLNVLDSIEEAFPQEASRSLSNEQTAAEQKEHTKQENVYSKDINQQLTEDDLQVINQSMDDINKSFALQRETGWDLSKGIEFKSDIKLLINTHRIIKKSTQLQSIIRLIGRQQTEYVEKHKKTGLNHKQSKNLNNTILDVDEHSINSVTGICYGDDIARMTSSELAILGNSKLKFLWHAKLSERQLTNYHFQGLLSSHVPEIQSSSYNHDRQDEEPSKLKGPMVLCVDTSASMKGRSESIAKAIALEAMRVAYLENRACYLFCFSGPDEVIQLELDFHAGWSSIIEFLQLSFNGGTDINNVLLQSLKVQDNHSWSKADIVLISDGRFSLDDLIISKLNNVTNGLRVYGIQLGKWRTDAFRGICHRVFDLSNV